MVNYSHIHKHSNSKERKKERKLQEPISLIFTSTYVIHRSHRWLQRWKNMSNCNVMCEYRKYSYHELHTNEPLHLRVQYGNCPFLPSFLLSGSPQSKKPGTRPAKKKKKKGRKKQKKKQNHKSTFPPFPPLLHTDSIATVRCSV